MIHLRLLVASVCVVCLGATTSPVGAEIVVGNDQLTVGEDTGLHTIDVLSNDPAGSVIRTFTQGDKGEVGEVKDSSGATIQLTFTPAPNENGQDSFDYTVANEGVESIYTVTVTIAAVADAPVAQDDNLPLSGTLSEGAQVVITDDLLANDSDADGQELTVVDVTTADAGEVSLDQGVVTYTASDDSATEATFGYTVSDGDESTANASAIVNVQIVPVDDPPTAVESQSATVSEGASVEWTLDQLIASDPDGGPGTVSITGEPLVGEAVINDGGGISYTHDGSENLDAQTITFGVSGGAGEPSSGVLNVEITPVDDAPVAKDDEATVVEEGTVDIDVLVNDTDDDDKTSNAVVSVSTPARGTAAINIEGGITYTAVGDVLGDDTFTYTLSGVDGSDTGGTSATVTVSVTNGDDDAPAVDTPAEVSIDEDADPATIVILSEGQTDVDGETLSLADWDDPALGSVELGVAGTLIYTPTPDAFGTDEFSVWVSDSTPEGEVTGDQELTVTVTIAPVADPPVAEDDYFNSYPEDRYYDDHFGGNLFIDEEYPEMDPDGPGVTEDTPTVLEILDNDTDADPDTNLAVVADSLELDAEIGTLTVVDGGVLFSPAEDFYGEFSFSYTATDGELVSEPATVQVQVVNTEDELQAVDDEGEVAEDSVAYFDVLENDIDVDDTGFSLIEITQPEGGFVAVAGSEVRVEPDPNFTGALNFEYTIQATHSLEEDEDSSDGLRTCDPNDPDTQSDPEFDELGFFGRDVDPRGPRGCELVTGYVEVEVLPVGDRPDSANDDVETDEDTPITIDVLANDTDADGDELSIFRVNEPELGSVEVNEDNELVYTPDQDVSGVDRFVYYSTDGSLLSLAIVRVEIAAVNDDPTIVGDTDLTVLEDGTLTFPVEIDDVDSEGLTVSAPEEVVSVEVDGTTVTYTPPENWFGEESFDLTVVDGDGGQATATFVVTVESVNDKPTIDSQEIVIDEDNTGHEGVLVFDDIEDRTNLSVAIGTEPTKGSVEVAGNEFFYEPDENENGQDSFTVIVTDSDEATAEATVSVTITPVNDDPTIVGGEYDTDEDEDLTFQVEIDDVDGDDLIVSVTADPDNGEVTVDGTTVTFSPADNWNGEDSFDLTVVDRDPEPIPDPIGEFFSLVLIDDPDGPATDDGGSATVTVVVTVASVNDEPTIEDQEIVVEEDNDVAGELVLNDIEDGTELSVAIGTEPTKGSVSFEGNSFNYEPDENENGQDSFTVIVTDSDEATAEATVSVTITPVNDDPTIAGGEYDTDEDVDLTFDVTIGDVDGDELAVSVSSQPEIGEVAVDGIAVTYSSPDDWHGETSFALVVDDGVSKTGVEATYDITVVSVNDQPSVSAPTITLVEDSQGSSPVTTTDIEDDFAERAVGIEISQNPRKGTVEYTDGELLYTPNPDENGEDSFNIVAIDSDNAYTYARVEVEITPVNDDPTATDCEPAAVMAAYTVEIDASECGTDIDGDRLMVDPRSVMADNGDVEVDGAMINFTPYFDVVGEMTIGFVLTDGNGGTVESSVLLNVEELPNPYIGVGGGNGEIVRIYSAMLGRRPDGTGFDYWTGLRDDGTSLEDIITNFAQSTEFLNVYGEHLRTDTDTEWIEFVYQQIHGRKSDAAGRAYWLNQLSTGMITRQEMVVYFAESQEYKNKTETL